MHSLVLKSMLKFYLEDLEEYQGDPDIDADTLGDLHTKIGIYYAIQSDEPKAQDHFYQALEYRVKALTEHPAYYVYHKLSAECLLLNIKHQALPQCLDTIGTLAVRHSSVDLFYDLLQCVIAFLKKDASAMPRTVSQLASIEQSGVKQIRGWNYEFAECFKAIMNRDESLFTAQMQTLFQRFHRSLVAAQGYENLPFFVMGVGVFQLSQLHDIGVPPKQAIGKKYLKYLTPCYGGENILTDIPSLNETCLSKEQYLSRPVGYFHPNTPSISVYTYDLSKNRVKAVGRYLNFEYSDNGIIMEKVIHLDLPSVGHAKGHCQVLYHFHKPGLYFLLGELQHPTRHILEILWAVIISVDNDGINAIKTIEGPQQDESDLLTRLQNLASELFSESN